MVGTYQRSDTLRGKVLAICEVPETSAHNQGVGVGFTHPTGT